jgi:hypothetical protein
VTSSPNPPTRIRFLASGNWKADEVSLERVATSRRIVPEVERLVEQTWQRETAKKGVRLFDGPMCRLESFDASADRLRLAISPTSYRIFAGTHLHNAHLVERFGDDVMAKALGVSSLVETADGMLVLGRRNASVAVYANRVHTFGGSPEPADRANVFATAGRELREELSLETNDLAEMTCVGIVADVALGQPELIFTARSALPSGEVRGRLDDAEHAAVWTTPTGQADVDAALGDAVLTPVAVASFLLWGRLRFGDGWFSERSAGFRA